MTVSSTVSSEQEAARMQLSVDERRLLRFIEARFFRSDIIVTTGWLEPDKPLRLLLVYADTVNPTVDPVITLHEQGETNHGLGTLLRVFKRRYQSHADYLLRVVQGIAPYNIDPLECRIESGAAYDFKYLPNRRSYVSGRGFA